jgi:O2-independent ubiquinone biosynthesis protein UbiV
MALTRGGKKKVARTAKAAITLGPLLFNWSAAKREDFYYRIADEAPIDSVCLGEVVCAKRTPFYETSLPKVIERLASAGKEVILSTLPLINHQRDMEFVRATVATPGYAVEANDVAAIEILRGHRHYLGPYVNVYNEGTLRYLAALGATRVCLPVELPAKSIGVLAKTGAVEVEVFAFGRLPLAMSARCFHARSCGRHRDNCEFVCEQDPDGLVVDTLDHQAVFAVSGSHILSHPCGSLVGELDALQKMGVRRFRLSPQDVDMIGVAGVFRDALDGQLEAGSAHARLGELIGGIPFCNGFYHDAEGETFVGPELRA